MAFGLLSGLTKRALPTVVNKLPQAVDRMNVRPHWLAVNAAQANNLLVPRGATPRPGVNHGGTRTQKINPFRVDTDGKLIRNFNTLGTTAKPKRVKFPTKNFVS